LEAFLQYGRPALLYRRTSNGALFNPLSLWVGASGCAMELNYVTKEVRRLAWQFNPYLNVTPYTTRRTVATNVFVERIPLGGMALEDFTKRLSLLMNVSKKVLTERYNRHKALNKNAQTQELLTTPTKDHVQADLQSAQSSMARLLQGKSVIEQVETAKITRPVRQVLDDDEWWLDFNRQVKELGIKKKDRKKFRKSVPALASWRARYEKKLVAEEQREEEEEEEEEEAQDHGKGKEKRQESSESDESDHMDAGKTTEAQVDVDDEGDIYMDDAEIEAMLLQETGEASYPPLPRVDGQVIEPEEEDEVDPLLMD